YRLFTVALMLGNKFLDDNTFTNKTWSEVSGMKVTDLNIMELEFLEVLRFKLFIRNDEFERWKSALLLF
ncbi:cyclin, partial [Mucor lusitanicus CBS 277.49]